MINELFKKLPELLKSVLEKVTSSPSSNKTVQLAQQKLVAQMKVITDELSRFTELKGEKMSEEQIQKIMSLPRPASPNVPWISVAPAAKKGDKD